MGSLPRVSIYACLLYVLVSLLVRRKLRSGLELGVIVYRTVVRVRLCNFATRALRFKKLRRKLSLGFVFEDK